MTIANMSKLLDTLSFARSIGDRTFEECIRKLAEWEERTRRSDYRPDLTYTQKVEECRVRFDGDATFAPHDYYFQFNALGPDLQFSVQRLNGGIILHKSRCETKAERDEAHHNKLALYQGESYKWETCT